MEDSTKKAYKNADNDPRGPYRLLGVWLKTTRWSSFALYSQVCANIRKKVWLVNESTMNKLDSENRLVFEVIKSTESYF